MKIAKRTTFEGKPIITTPSVIGGAPDKPFFFRPTAIGERPISISVGGLPMGLTFDGLTVGGVPPLSGCFYITVKAENAVGTDEKVIRLEIYARAVQRTPLMGFTTWNAFDSRTTQDDVVRTAALLDETGLADHGYLYVNLDSCWQDKYGGKYDAIEPSDKFPDMKGMVEKIHSRGMKAGIYSTPFLHAWGCPQEKEWIPGCTVGERDLRFPDANCGIGKDRREKNNVAQWCEWGIDYLKYDWTPTDAINADIMRKALDESPRDFVYCVTVHADINCADYWRRNANSYRCGTDTTGKWETESALFDSYEPWEKLTGYGHYYDLDMLAIGEMEARDCLLTDDEKVFAYSARAFLQSPIQLSCKLGSATDFELDLYSNEEIIAINQDGLLSPAVYTVDESKLRVLERALENGDTAIGMFNSSDNEREISYDLKGEALVRDVWAKEDLGRMDKICVKLPPHGAMIYRVK